MLETHNPWCGICQEEIGPQDWEAGTVLSTWLAIPSPKNVLLDQSGRPVHADCWRAERAALRSTSDD